MPLKVGYHINNAGLSNYSNIIKALKKAVKSGADVMQVFLKSPRLMSPRDYLVDSSDKKIKQFIRLKNKEKVLLFVHASYMANLSHPVDSLSAKKSRKSIKLDWINANILEAEGVIIHMGINVDKLKQSYDQAVKNMADNIKILLVETNLEIKKKKLPALKTKLLLENSARQKNKLGYDVQGIHDIWSLLGPKEHKHMGICLDTAHLFAAGKDLRSKEKVNELIIEFDKIIGLEYLKAFHYNDSQVPLDARDDKHEDFLYGYITDKELGGSTDGMEVLTKLAKERTIPIMLEVLAVKAESFRKFPIDKQLKLVRTWAKN